MPYDIATLPTVNLDYTARGPGLFPGMARLEALLEESRAGYLLLNVKVNAGTLPVIMARSDLYIVGFRSSTGWFRFSDADWPFASPAESLGYDGQYTTLGGLVGHLDSGAISAIGRLLDVGKRPHWKPALRTLLVVVAEYARLIPVRMYVLGLLNGPLQLLPLAAVERYIKNWSKASKGHDMSVQVGPNHWVGFSNPVIIPTSSS